ncbi:MAG TPA: XRE family transcriptional regulator [Planctomycetaceae bacterium]|nr:XRE family transcriptional regulator [Planctomycetaceae bacterium]
MRRSVSEQEALPAGITFRLNKILRDKGKFGYGVIKEIHEYTKLERHLISKLIQGKVRSISWQTLGQICLYLRDKLDVDLADLPGILFGFEAAEFWEMLSQSDVTLTVGVRRVDGVERRWVNAYDAYLLGEVLNGLFRLGHEKLANLTQHLVLSYRRGEDLALCIDQAEGIHKAFHEEGGNRALICIGSVKSNPVTEWIAAEMFGARPFESQDRMRSAKRRTCPFFLQFRPDDPDTPSCHGGFRLATSRGSKTPGIYYETRSGRWECCPSAGTEDSALILYAYRPPEGTMELVLAGFSGRATGATALKLRALSLRAWPPNYDREHIKIGVFIVRFLFPEETDPQRAAWPMPVEPIDFDCTAVDEEVLARRLDRLKKQ